MYNDGRISDYHSVPQQELEVWKKKIETQQSRPEPQLMSEYSQKAGRPADLAIYYHNTILLAQQWCKGKQLCQ